MIQLRKASRQDATFLVPLVAESSGGVWPAIWKALARQGESVEQSAARYISNSANDLSVDNAMVAQSKDQQPLGVLISYRETPMPESQQELSEQLALPQDLNEALNVYRQLSDPDSLFISELCILPQARGKGLGTRFLEYTADCARKKYLARVSLRVFSQNTGAVRLYQRFGFELVDQLPVTRHPDITFSDSVLLMAYNV